MLNSADLLKTVQNGNVINYPCELLICDKQGRVATMYDIDSYDQMVEQILYLSYDKNLMYRVVCFLDKEDAQIADYDTDLPF